ncbi:MAG: hypothetical protein ACKOVH_07360, partial [Actinomycetota bacterium]
TTQAAAGPTSRRPTGWSGAPGAGPTRRWPPAGADGLYRAPAERLAASLSRVARLLGGAPG